MLHHHFLEFEIDKWGLRYSWKRQERKQNGMTGGFYSWMADSHTCSPIEPYVSADRHSWLESRSGSQIIFYQLILTTDKKA